jgi:serine protease Do
MKKIFKIFLLFIFLQSNSLIANARDVSKGFADLAEKAMPSVVNISATRIVETRGGQPFPFQFPPGSPFEDFF